MRNFPAGQRPMINAGEPAYASKLFFSSPVGGVSPAFYALKLNMIHYHRNLGKKSNLAVASYNICIEIYS